MAKLSKANPPHSKHLAEVSKSACTNSEPAKGSAVSSEETKERFKTLEIMQELADAMNGVELDKLPDDPMSDVLRTIRRQLIYALAQARPMIEPEEPHHVPFHLQLTEEQADLFERTRQEIWSACLSLLSGLEFLRERGYVTEYGVEIPASGTMGDLHYCLKDGQESLTRLEGMVEKLARFGSLKSAAALVGTQLMTESINNMKTPNQPPFLPAKGTNR